MATWTEEFASLAPWVTSFEVEGRRLGGPYDAVGDARLARFFTRFPSPGRVLELGCLEGGHTLAIARAAFEVVAVDARPENISKARLMQRVYGVGNVRFVEADLDAIDLADYGAFDVAFNVGLLYHLEAPWRLLAWLAKCCRAMFLWTHVARGGVWGVRRGGYRGRLYREGGVADPLSGLNPRSFWPTQTELLRMVRDAGFGEIEILDVDPSHPHGSAVLLTCRSLQFDEGSLAPTNRAGGC